MNLLNISKSGMDSENGSKSVNYVTQGSGSKQKPDGSYTNNIEEYAESWMNVGKDLENIFTGYKVSSSNPGFELVKYRTLENGERIISDRFRISSEASILLIKRFENK